MVIECTECHTRFKLADDKVKPGGTKVRCSKCKQIFTVMPPEPVAAPPVAPAVEEEIDFGAFNMERLAGQDSEPAAPPPTESAAAPWDRERGESTPEEFSFGQQTKEEFAFGEAEAGPSGDFSFGDRTAGQQDEAPFGSETSEEFTFGPGKEAPGLGEFTFEAATGERPDEAPSGSGTASDFAFGEETEALPGDSTFGFDESEDFSFDDDQPAAEGSAGPKAYSSAEDETAGSVEFAFEEGGAGSETGTEFSWDEGEAGAGNEGLDFGGSEKPADDDFDFSGITFGEEEAASAGPRVEEQRLAPIQAQPALLETETLSPLREPAAPRAAAEPRLEPFPTAPLTPPRRKSPLRGLMFFAGLLLLALIGGAVYFYWQGGIPELTALVDRLTGQTAPTQASGQIRIEELTSFYVAHQDAGQMLIIQGKATNGYPQPRSSLTVKGVLFNKAGTPLLQQTVFCGNPLSQEALKKLPFAKIEESMNNPFGKSLSNLNVAPGKAIPFTIVFRNLPADIAEFTVEAADSKPGTKQ